MNKILLILKREFLTRVRKKSFILMSILGPVIFAAFLIVPAWIAQLEDTEEKIIAVIDSSKVFFKTLPETNTIKFEYLENNSVEDVKKNFSETNYYAVLYISHTVSYVENAVKLYSDKQPSLSVRMHISNAIEERIEKEKLQNFEIQDLENILKSIETNINIQTIKWTRDGEEKESSAELAMVVGYVFGFLIYMFILLFGVQVMRGVIEEKTNRIVEVIISSVKPFQLMMGKILGIALVAITQFVIWVFLTTVLTISVQLIAFPELSTPRANQVVAHNILTSDIADETPIEAIDNTLQNENMDEVKSIITSIKNINFPVILGSFLFYFLGGYLLYASFFALVGSAVDNETDTQQFMMPITIPLIISIFVMLNVIQTPDSSLAFWFSMIPLSSPIVMMVRIPFGVPYWQVGLSICILILSFIGTTWLAGKVYRTGILMYGKKSSYKEIWKWLRYKS